jgi:hypothetical protein
MENDKNGIFMNDDKEKIGNVDVNDILEVLSENDQTSRNF